MIAMRQGVMRRHRTKLFLAGALAAAWSSLFLLGYVNHPGAENRTHLRERRRSRRALAEYFDTRSYAPYDNKTITVYLVEPMIPNVAYPGYSLFKTGMLKRYGSGKFSYDVKDRARCDRSCRMPVVNSGRCIVAARDKDCPLKYLQCNFPQCKTMLLGDERCWGARTPHDIRAYYTATSAAAYLPLGPRFDSWKAFETIQAQPGFATKPSSQRDYAFSSIFSQDTEKARKQLALIVNWHRSSSRSSLRVFSTMPKEWTQHVNDLGNSHLNTFAYTNALLDSVFTLSPAGHNPECFRLFEAVEAGSIPVLVKRDLTTGKTHKCQDSLHHWRDAPVVKLDSWDDLFPTVEKMMEDKERLDKMQTDLLAWYGDYMHKVVADFEDFMHDSYTDEFGEDGTPYINLAAEKAPGRDPCDDIVLFVPDIHLSLGRQLNHYLLAVMMATFMDKAIVILDAPQDLICPSGDLDHPLGFSSIVRHPEWLTRKCAIPCQATYEYSDWDSFRRMPEDVSPVTPCTDNRGNRTDVVVVGGDETRAIFDKYFKNIMTHRSSSVAYDWALRVGAKPEEAEAFSKLEGDVMWDYIGAILIRSGVLRFQHSVKVDSSQHIRAGIYREGPYHASFDAMHIPRGEGVFADPKAKKYIDNYWDTRGYYDRVTQTSVRGHIPTLQYLRHYHGQPCSDQVRKVYVATDDPIGVEAELVELGRDSYGTVRFNDCQALKFKVSPIKQDLGTGNDCAARYANIIATIADFIMLSNADAFVGEFLSDWGRLVRIFRLKLNPEVETISDRGSLRPLERLLRTQNSEAPTDPSPVLLRNTNVAWGYSRPPTPL